MVYYGTISNGKVYLARAGWCKYWIINGVEHALCGNGVESIKIGGEWRQKGRERAEILFEDPVTPITLKEVKTYYEDTLYRAEVIKDDYRGAVYKEEKPMGKHDPITKNIAHTVEKGSRTVIVMVGIAIIALWYFLFGKQRG